MVQVPDSGSGTLMHGTKSQILEETLSWYQVPDPGGGTLMIPSPRSWKRHSHGTKSQILEVALS